MSPVLVIATGTVTGQVVNGLGLPVAGLPVTAKLNAGVSTPQTISPVGQVVPGEVSAFTDATGAWSLALVPNNNINPANTTYTIQIPGQPDVYVQLNDTLSHVYTTIAVNPTTAVLAPVGQTIAGALTVAGLLTAQAELDVTGPAVFHGPNPWVDITHPAYGGKADGVTDNSAAFVSALAALPSTGGTIFFPPSASAYIFASAISLVGKSFVRLRGAGPTYGGGAATSSLIRFTGTSGPLVAASGTTGIELEDLYVQWPSAFTGTVVDFSGVLSGNVLRRCFFSANGGGSSAAVIVGLDNAQRVTIERTQFHNAQVGIQGLATSGHFSIAIKIRDCNFSSSVGDIAVAHISNVHQNWVIADNVFEMGQSAGNCSIIGAPLSAGTGVQFTGNWSGDQGANAITQVNAGNGWLVAGNYFAGASATTAIAVPNSSNGVTIIGNKFDTSFSVAVAIGTTVNNFLLGPNDHSGATTYLTGTPNSGGMVLTNGTISFYGAINFTSALSANKNFQRSTQTPTETVLVSGVDATLGEHVSVTLTAARLVGAPLNPALGDHLYFTLTQGGAGAFAVTWNAVFKVTWSDAGNATGKISTVGFWYNGTNWAQLGAQAPYV